MGVTLIYRTAHGPELVAVKYNRDTNLGTHRTTVPTVMSCKGVVPFKRLGHSTNIFSRVPSGILLAQAKSIPLLLMFTRLSNSSKLAGRSHGLVARIQLERISRFNPAFIVHIQHQLL
jgi:hypothetical protein